MKMFVKQVLKELIIITSVYITYNNYQIKNQLKALR